MKETAITSDEKWNSKVNQILFCKKSTKESLQLTDNVIYYISQNDPVVLHIL